MTAPRQRQTGLALIAVLWAIALMTIMAGSFSLTLQRDSGLVTTLETRSKGIALAEAGLRYAMLMLSSADPTKRWRSDGTIYDARLPGGQVRIQIADEAGKFDINGSQEPTFNGVFTKLLGDPEKAAAITDAILDWRDNDNTKRLHGAEESDYAAAGKENTPRNRGFQDLTELQNVMGMTPALYRKLEPMLTIYTGQAGINAAKANKETLMMLPGLDERTVDSYIQQRKFALPGSPPPQLPVAAGGVQMGGAADFAYAVSVEAMMPEKQIVTIHAVMRRQRAQDGSPFVFLSWRPQFLGRGAPPDQFSAS